LIHLTRLDGTPIVVNADLITMVETLPDSVVCLTTGSRIMVRESADEIVAAALEYRRTLLAGLPVDPPRLPARAVHPGAEEEA
jgi:flagellar protein FlbD